MSTHKMKKPLFSLIGGFLALFILSLLHITQGQADFTIAQLITGIGSNEQMQHIVFGLRLPRLAVGILAGAALAASGVLLQTLTNNPLASASTLGIHAGAYFFVVCTVIFFPAVAGQYPFFVALAGAALSSLLVFLLAGKTMEPVRVALTGMIISLLFFSFTKTLQLLFENETTGLFLWGSGTLIQHDWSGVRFSLPLILAGSTAALLLAKPLDLYALGEKTAVSLGQSVFRVKMFAWLTAIALASATVSVVGPIGFVGLIAPHLVRLMGIRSHAPLLLHAMLWGSVLLIAADVAARWIQPGEEIPVGAVTALIGGPWLMFLAYRTGKKLKRGERSLGATASPLALKWLAPLLALIVCGSLYVSISYGGGTFFTWQDWLNEKWAEPFIWQFRIPRVISAFFAGVLLAMSGVLLQGVLRNSLADPTVLGITSGGGAGAMIYLVLLPSAPVVFLPFAAFLGAFAAVAVILFAARKNGWQPILLALMGVSVSAFGSAIIHILVVKAELGVAAALVWLSGSTYAKGWDVAAVLFWGALLTLPLAFFAARSMDILSTGDDVASGLGVRVPATRLAAIILGVVMSAVSVSMVGTIGFIGLLAPHAARRLVGMSHRKILFVSLLLGGILLVSADFFGRFLLAPKEIPSGLVVSLLGTPYLLYLLKRK